MRQKQALRSACLEERRANYSCAAGRRHNIHFIIFLAEFVFFFTAGVDLSGKNIYNKCVRVKAPFLRALKCPKHAGQTAQQTRNTIPCKKDLREKLALGYPTLPSPYKGEAYRGTRRRCECALCRQPRCGFGAHPNCVFAIGRAKIAIELRSTRVRKKPNAEPPLRRTLGLFESSRLFLSSVRKKKCE